MKMVKNIIQPQIDTLWTDFSESLFSLLQDLVVEKLGDTCPAIEVDLTSARPKVGVLDALRFEGGKAVVIEADLPIVDQISRAIEVIYQSIDQVNDKMEERGLARTFQMVHLRFEGHVQKSKKSTEERSLIISQARAQTVVSAVEEAGVPTRFLHPQGYGYSQPIGTPEQNRRVEIR